MTRERQKSIHDEFSWLSKHSEELIVPLYSGSVRGRVSFEAYLAHLIASTGGLKRPFAQTFRALRNMQMVQPTSAPERVTWPLAHLSPGVALQLVTHQSAPMPTGELRTAMLGIARTKAALTSLDALYEAQRADTGLTSAQQYLAAKQKRREQQSE